MEAQKGSENEVLLKEVLYNPVMMGLFIHQSSSRSFTDVAELAIQSARYEKSILLVAVKDEL
ncbi:hypothetical protein TSUD_06440 [Trifolium subterraneum]|uniref:Uncharacterized protein n=1 Tax=Trifolium subterraneum TaxID=3900 RepID=A0A2Z6MP34_TRISU|nr:hypothetical protein TSUD_06440 [Trifolium subterraneum]